MKPPPAVELLDPTPGGRTFVAERPVRLGDVDPDGRLRLDAIARYLQDVAADDADDADLDGSHAWLVRRTLIEVAGDVVAGDRLRLTTFCTGAGRSWAERRTSVVARRESSDEPAARVEAVSLWVQIDTSSGRPARLGDGFDAVWGTAAAGRTVSSKLSLPATPGDDARPRPWRFRRTDLDPFGHVNNAAHWSVVEELLHELAPARRGRAEIEYLAPTAIDADLTLWSAVDSSGGFDVWLLDDERTVTTARWRPR